MAVIHSPEACSHSWVDRFAEGDAEAEALQAEIAEVQAILTTSRAEEPSDEARIPQSTAMHHTRPQHSRSTVQRHSMLHHAALCRPSVRQLCNVIVRQVLMLQREVEQLQKEVTDRPCLQERASSFPVFVCTCSSQESWPLGAAAAPRLSLLYRWIAIVSAAHLSM